MARPESPADEIQDPVTDYALAVITGEKTAGPHVRAACHRHMSDLMMAEAKGFYFDREAALDKMLFFQEELQVQVPGFDEPQPFYLMDFQCFIVGSIFGWKWSATGYRRFRSAYVECGKGSGKSPLAAGIGLIMGLEDNEPKPEIYAAGSKKEQAKILFKDAVDMIKASDDLKARCVILGGNEPRLVKFTSGGEFGPVAADKKKSGPRPHCALVDELHEHRDRYTIDIMQDGFKGRTQPLLFVITNSGFDRTTICWEWHQKAIKVAHGLMDDETLFSMVFSLDEEDDPLEDESCWPKTNPGLGQTITMEYIRTQVQDAREIPGRENSVRRLNFCEWTEADTGWMTRHAWVSCESAELGHYSKGAFIAPDFEGAVCNVGLDLSFSFDLTAIALAFEDGDHVCLWIEYFTPADTAREREKTDAVPYVQWIRDGLIHGVPGKIVRPEFIARRLGELAQVFDIQHVAFDRYAHKSLADQFEELGVSLPMIEHPQGFRRGGKLPHPDYQDENGKAVDNPLWMPDSVKQFEEVIIERTLEVAPSPVTKWQVSSVAIRPDPAGTGNRIMDKRKAYGRIDGIVAGAMAIGATRTEFPDMMDLSGFLNSPVISR